ncbi:methionyl-tRNA formyltransferase [Chloroflexota bacterium]
MRIVVTGQADFGAEVIKSLVSAGEEVVQAFAPLGRRGEPVKKVAESFGIPVFQAERLKNSQSLEIMKNVDPDLGVMAFVTEIIPIELIRCPKLGTIQYHPSLLPRHRGGSAINWAIIQEDMKTGLTIFWPDEGIDTGPILLQKEVQIDPDDTMGSIYFEKLFPLGVEAIVESVRLIKEGRPPRISQDESQATYEGLCTEEVALIWWNEPVSEVHNLIKGTNPQPGAFTFHRGNKLKIFDCSKVEGVSGLPGGVIGVRGDSFLVAASGGAIEVKRVQVPPEPKTTASEYVKRLGVKEGERLG